MNKMNINGLTAYQVALLDLLWAMDSLDEIDAWRSWLPADQQADIDLLMQLLILESIDDETSSAEHFPEACTVLEQFM